MNEVQRTAFELCLPKLREMAQSNHDLTGCLLAACSAHDPDKKQQRAVIKFLKRSGVSVNETDKNGVTPLHRAVRFRSLETVQLLLELGANVNSKDCRSQSTPLHRAVTNTGAPKTAGKRDVAERIAKALLANGADAKAKNRKGKTASDYLKSAARKEAFGF